MSSSLLINIDVPGLQKGGDIAVMADPFANGFCLLQFFGNGYDEDI